jgi:hypothetical protein
MCTHLVRHQDDLRQGLVISEFLIRTILNPQPYCVVRHVTSQKIHYGFGFTLPFVYDHFWFESLAVFAVLRNVDLDGWHSLMHAVCRMSIGVYA